MYHEAVNIRDPFFWRWHKHIDDLNFAYQEKLAPHDFSDAPRVTFGGGDDQGIVLLEAKSIFDVLPRDSLGRTDMSVAEFVGVALGSERFSRDAAVATIPFKLPRKDKPDIDTQVQTVEELLTEMRQGVFELSDPDYEGKKFR